MNQVEYGGTVNVDAAAGRTRAARWGWGILLTVSGLLTLNGVLLYLVIDESPQVQTTSILVGGFGLLALIVALEGFRQAPRWAWNGMWVVVATLALVGLHILSVGDRIDVGVWYLALGAIALAGQLLAGGWGGRSG